jgi:predicted metalloprotease
MVVNKQFGQSFNKIKRISFCIGYGQVAADSISNALVSEDFSFSTYREKLIEHEVGQVLMNLLGIADKLYCSKTEDVKGLLRSFLGADRMDGVFTRTIGKNNVFYFLCLNDIY